MARILLVEDEDLVGTMVRLNLVREGHEVEWYRDGEGAVLAATSRPFDVVLMDIMLPGMSGIDAVRSLRAAGFHAPILMLTSRGDLGTKVESFEDGADDFLTKPFDVPELLARVRALVRRSQAERVTPSDRLIRIGPFMANLDTRTASSREGEVVLTEKEAALLHLFARNPGVTLSRADILEDVWGMDASPTERTVDNFVMRLRRLFEEDPQRPRHFLTVRAAGYRFVP